MAEQPWTISGDVLTLRVFIQPRASRNELCGLHDDAIKLRITAPPVDGAANECCCQFLARVFDVPKSAVQVRSGHSSRKKLITITGAIIPQAEALLVSAAP